MIIPTRNRSNSCRDTVTALFHQTLAPSEYEIIIVDDGSNPPFQMSCPQGAPSVRIIRIEGRERSAARNTGAQAALADLVVFLDDDISVSSSFLEAHMMAHREWEGALIVGAVNLPAEMAERPFRRFRAVLETQGTSRPRGVTHVSNFCTAANMSIARRHFLRLGGFDESLVSGEDQDLALRHSEAGTIVFLPEAVGIHRDNTLDVRSYCRRTEWGSEHLVAFCRKHPRFPDNVRRERVNGPIRWGHEPHTHSARKAAKKLAAYPPILDCLFAVTALAERVVPHSRALEKLYHLLLGVHIYRGYRRGADRPTCETSASLGFL